MDETTLADIIVENNGDGTGIIRVTPKKEGKDTITITATNPTTKEQYSSKNITLDFKYDQVTVIPRIISQNGNFSYMENDILFLGDGETVTLDIDIEEPNVSWSLKSISISKLGTTSNKSYAAVSGSSSQFKIVNSTDVTLKKYYIPEFYEP